MENEIMQPEVIPNHFQCTKCGKPFDSIQALRMHKIRVHTRAGIQGAKKGSQEAGERRLGTSTKADLIKRRQYQRKLRDRYYAEGRNSKGEPMPPGWKPRPRHIDGSKTATKKKAYMKIWYERKKQALADAKAAAPEIWLIARTGIITCPHCQKVVGEIKSPQTQQEANHQWHIA